MRLSSRRAHSSIRPALRRYIQHREEKTEDPRAESAAPEPVPSLNAGSSPAALPSGLEVETIYEAGEVTGVENASGAIHRAITPIHAQVAPTRKPRLNGSGIPANGILPLISRAFNAHSEQVAVFQQSSSRAGALAMAVLVITTLIWGAGMLVGFETALAVQMGFGFLLAIIGLLSPALGLLSIGILSALDPLASELLLTGGLLRFNTINYWLLIVMALYLPFLIRLNDLNSRLLQLFIALLAVQLLYSSNRSTGIQDVFNLLTTFGLVIYFARALQDEQILYWLGVVVGGLSAVGGLVFLLQINSLPYANPNNWTYFQLTGLFAICISFPFAHLLRKSKAILIILAAVNFTWIFLSASRGSLLIAILCVGYLFLSTRSITWSTALVAIAIVLGLWASTMFVERQSYTISRIQLLFDETEDERTRTSQRSALAAAGWQIFLDNPGGIGTGSFREEAASTNLVRGRRPAHSAWIKTLAENGVLGIILMTAFIGSYAVIGFRKRHEGKLLFGLFITILFAGAFVAKEFRGKSLWFLAAGGIVLMHPELMLHYLKKKSKPVDVDSRTRLREVRFGRRE